MTAMVLTAGYVAVNAVTYAGQATKIEVTVDVDEQDVTTFASAGWKEVLGGLKSGELSLSFLNDFSAGASSIDAQLWTLLGTVTTFEVRPTQGARSVTNPGFTGSVLINSLKPINGSPGDANAFDVSWPTSGAVTRQTS